MPGEKAEDNLKYGTKKYFKQSFKQYADIIEEGLKEGIDALDQQSIDIMSRKFNDIVKSGADKSEALKQMKSIVKEYMENKSIKDSNKDPQIQRFIKRKKEVDI